MGLTIHVDRAGDTVALQIGEQVALFLTCKEAERLADALLFKALLSEDPLDSIHDGLGL